MPAPKLRYDPFETLSWDVLLGIAVYLPDLPSIVNFDKASATFAILFNSHGAEIVEAALENSLPLETRGLIRLTVYLRSLVNGEIGDNRLPLNSFVDHQLFTRPDSAAVRPLPRDTSPSLLRGMLATAVKIEALTEACLAEFMSRCLKMAPRHLVDKTVHFRHRFWETGFQEPEGRPYQPHSSGPPSWIERQTARRAFYYVQMFVDLVNAVSRRCIGWIEGKLADVYDVLKIEELEVFRCKAQEWPVITVGWSLGSDATFQWQEWSVLDYLEDIGWTVPICMPFCQGREDKQYVHLPWPPNESKPFEWEETGKARYPGIDEPCEFHPPGELGSRLSPGWRFCWRYLTLSPHKPLFGLEDRPGSTDRRRSPFRRLGLYFWDSRRLMALELLGPDKVDGFLETDNFGGMFKYFSHDDLVFTWRSLLTPEELAEQRARGDEISRHLYGL